MDKEGHNANTSAFHSEDIGNQATTEFFSNVTGGRKDKDKIERKRIRVSRKALFVIFGALAAISVVILFTILIINLNSRPHGSRTDEALPSSSSEIEERAYKVLYSGDPRGYYNAIYYLKNLIQDMEDAKQNPELIFDAYALRARIAYMGGGGETAINEALRLANKAETDNEKYTIYKVLFYMYNQEGDKERRDFYGDMMYQLNVEANKLGGEGGYEDTCEGEGCDEYVTCEGEECNEYTTCEGEECDGGEDE